MINTLKSDFYKLLRQKSFYVCLLLSMLAAALSMFIENQSLKMMYAQYNIPYDPSEAGMTGIAFLQNGITMINPMYLLIFMVLFVSMEFSKGTLKNQVSRGRLRSKIYLSKLVVTVVSALVFMVLTLCAGYLMSVQIGGAGEAMTKEIALSILKSFGFYFLTLVSYLSLFLMFTFLVRSTGFALAIVLLTDLFIGLLSKLINMSVKYLFNVDFSALKYWIGSCFTMLPENATQNDILIRIAICVSYSILSTAIGVYAFWRSEIK